MVVSHSLLATGSPVHLTLLSLKWPRMDPCGQSSGVVVRRHRSGWRGSKRTEQSVEEAFVHPCFLHGGNVPARAGALEGLHSGEVAQRGLKAPAMRAVRYFKSVLLAALGVPEERKRFRRTRVAKVPARASRNPPPAHSSPRPPPPARSVLPSVSTQQRTHLTRYTLLKDPDPS